MFFSGYTTTWFVKAHRTTHYKVWILYKLNQLKKNDKNIGKIIWKKKEDNVTELTHVFKMENPLNKCNKKDIQRYSKNFFKEINLYLQKNPLFSRRIKSDKRFKVRHIRLILKINKTLQTPRQKLLMLCIWDMLKGNGYQGRVRQNTIHRNISSPERTGILLYQSTMFLKKARGIFKYEKIQGFQHSWILFEKNLLDDPIWSIRRWHIKKETKLREAMVKKIKKECSELWIHLRVEQWFSIRITGENIKPQCWDPVSISSKFSPGYSLRMTGLVLRLNNWGNYGYKTKQSYKK